jgi:aspartate kinase
MQYNRRDSKVGEMPMELKVSKFGGTSVATPDMLKQIVRLLDMDHRRRCVVVSAPGKAPGFGVKVTDMLIQLTNAGLKGDDTSVLVKTVRDRFSGIYTQLGLSAAAIDKILADLDQRVQSPKADPRKYRDLIVASGEDYCARLFAEYLRSVGKKAVFAPPQEAGLIVSSQFGDAQPLPESSLRLAGLKKTCAESIVVFPGFFGITEGGDVATFSRGGSDLTGSILAEAIDAVEYENWTDVDGIYSANPTIVDKPEQIPALTYREMRELSYIGFNVLHEEAVRPVLKKKIPIRLRNTRNPDNPGTLIVSERLPAERDVIGIASGGTFCSVTLQKFLMNREVGFGRRLLSIVEKIGLSYEHCPSGVDNISIILDQGQLKPETLNNVIRAVEDELQPDEVKIEYGLALVAVVGEGLLHKVGVLAQACTALAEEGVNIKIANQGSSEISMIFGIDASDEKRAVNALYRKFFA